METDVVSNSCYVELFVFSSPQCEVIPVMVPSRAGVANWWSVDHCWSVRSYRLAAAALEGCLEVSQKPVRKSPNTRTTTYQPETAEDYLLTLSGA